MYCNAYICLYLCTQIVCSTTVGIKHRNWSGMRIGVYLIWRVICSFEVILSTFNKTIISHDLRGTCRLDLLFLWVCGLNYPQHILQILHFLMTVCYGTVCWHRPVRLVFCLLSNFKTQTPSSCCFYMGQCNSLKIWKFGLASSVWSCTNNLLHPILLPPAYFFWQHKFNCNHKSVISAY